MKSTSVRNLLVALICLFSGVQAHAQYQVSLEQYPTKDYSVTAQDFSLTEVATALGTDAATFAADLTAFIEAEAPAENLVYLVQPDGTESTNYTADAKGFWMSADGTCVDYGETAKFFAGMEADAENDVFSVYAGQYPEANVAGDVCNATLKVKYNGKEVTFAVTLSVIAKPVYDIPEPTVVEKDLNIVAEKELVVEQLPRGGYDADAVSLEIPDIVEKLGITSENILADDLASILYATRYNDGDVEQGGGMKKDTLSNESTAAEPGFWFRAVQNAEGIEDGEVAAAGYSDQGKFYFEGLKYDVATHTLSGNLGQYPGNAKAEDKYFANLYLVWGANAYKVVLRLNVKTPEQGDGLASLTKVGEESVLVKQEQNNDYAATTVKPNLEAIAAALGCEVSAIGMSALDENDNFAQGTANNGGWWFNQSGLVVAWGAGYMFIEPAENGNYAALNVGQHPDVCETGETYSSTVYFTNGTNYYAYTVNLEIVEPQLQDYNFESVADRYITLTQLPEADYKEQTIATISLDELNEILGTSDPTLYGLNVDSVAAVKGVYSKQYSCDPKPGFWLDADGRVTTWGNNSVMGLGFKSDGTVYSNQFPNALSVGDVFKAQLFLVNEETEKMVTYNITINIAESLVEKTVVGSESVVIKMDQDEQTMDIDLSAAATALEVSVADLLNSNNYYLHGLKKDGQYGAGVNCENGLGFDVDGGYNDYGDLFVYIDGEEGNVQLHAGSNNPVAEDFNVSAQFCFEIDNKQYVYYAKLVSIAEYAGIETVKADTRNGIIYDLQGRRIAQPTKGLYIRDGRKFMVK